MAGDTAKLAVAAAGVGAAALGLGYLLFRKPAPSGCNCSAPDVCPLSDGSCPTGYERDPANPSCCKKSVTCSSTEYPCPDGTCCPLGDLCPDSSGTCPQGTKPDPNFPGCCISECPPSCTQDSDCALCGAGFVCEGGACTQQRPGSWSGPTAADFPFDAAYQSTGCFIPFCSNCAKCNLKVTIPGNVLPQVVFQLLDRFGRPIPGVALGVTNNLTIPDIVPQLAFANTDADGIARVNLFTDELFGFPPFSNVDYDGYPCDACSGIGATGQFTLAVGSFTLYPLDQPSLGALCEVVVVVNFSEDVNNSLNGCPAC